MIDKLIWAPDDLSGRVQRLYRDGVPPGDSTGWPSVDKFYTVAAGQMTLVTGIPGMGKSEWLDALMVNLALNDGWRFALYSPENHPVELHVSKLVEKYVGAPFRKGPTKRMDEQTANEATFWVLENFIFLDPTYRDYQTLLEAAVLFRGTAKKFGVVLDPWNTLEHLRPAGLTETEYISAALTSMSTWVRTANLHLWIVAHPRILQKNPTTGKRDVPSPYDIAGSAHWYNKADNIVTVHRNQAEDQSSVEIYVQKVRFKHIGRLGVAELKYDRASGRYSDPQAIADTAAIRVCVVRSTRCGRRCRS